MLDLYAFCYCKIETSLRSSECCCSVHICIALPQAWKLVTDNKALKGLGNYTDILLGEVCEVNDSFTYSVYAPVHIRHSLASAFTDERNRAVIG